MANIPLGGQINVGLNVASCDAKYGPYNSAQEAFNVLGPDGMDVLAVGLTVGILQNDGSIKEYWFKSACDSAEDLVEKGGSMSQDDLDKLDAASAVAKGTITNVAVNDTTNAGVYNITMKNRAVGMLIVCPLQSLVVQFYLGAVDPSTWAYTSDSNKENIYTRYYEGSWTEWKRYGSGSGDIGNLSDLKTKAKSSIVAAINELVDRVVALEQGGGVKAEYDEQTQTINFTSGAEYDEGTGVVTLNGGTYDEANKSINL